LSFPIYFQVCIQVISLWISSNISLLKKLWNIFTGKLSSERCKSAFIPVSPKF
jgi:hypothetical protein